MSMTATEIQRIENEVKLNKLIAGEKAKLNASEADKKVMDFPIYDKPEEVETGLISSVEKVAVDNYSGRMNVISDKPSEGEIDFDTLELTEEEQAEIDKMVKEADLSGMNLTPVRMQKEILESFDFLSKKDREDFSKVIDRVRNKEQFSVYAALPESMKTFINFQSGANANRNLRNAKAREFVQNFVNQMSISTSIDAMSSLFDKKKDEELKKLGQELNSGYLALQKQRWDLYSLEADKILEKSETEEVSQEELDKAAKYKAFSKAFNDSYTLLPLIEDVKARRGKYRFKLIQLEKFNKECESFNIKYERSVYDIKEVGGCLPIVQRLIGSDDIVDAKLILLAFMKFTMNYKPDVVTEHIFMSNFVSNVYLSDTAITEEDMIIVDQLKEALKTLAGLL